MPAARGILDDEEMWRIVLFLRHLPPEGSLGDPPAYREDGPGGGGLGPAAASPAPPEATPASQDRGRGARPLARKLRKSPGGMARLK